MDDVFRPASLAIAFRAAPSEHHPVTPQEYPCVATAGRPRRISLTCHADTCSILPLHVGTLAASHKVHSRVRRFPLLSTCGQNFLRLRRADNACRMALVAERDARDAVDFSKARQLHAPVGGVLVERESDATRLRRCAHPHTCRSPSSGGVLTWQVGAPPGDGVISLNSRAGSATHHHQAT